MAILSKSHGFCDSRPRFWILILGLLFFPVVGWGTTVTATLKDVGGNVLTGKNDCIVFQLRNYGSNQPKVTASGVLLDVKPFKACMDGSGPISVTITDNYSISPAGTFYRVTSYQKGEVFRSADYLICTVTGGACSGTISTFDLNSVAPITTTPVVIPPSGDTTYQRLDGGNQSSGNYVPSADATLSLGAVGARWNAVLGTVTATDFRDKGGQVYNVKAYGAVGNGVTDDTTAIQTAIAALPTDGTVFFPPGTYGISGTLVLGTSQHMAGPATLKWIGAAPGGLTDMLTVGNSLASSERQSVDQLTFDGANNANLVGLHVLNCHDGRFARLTFQNFNGSADTALVLEGNLSGVNTAENHFDHVTMPLSGSAGTVVHGITLTGTGTSFVTNNYFFGTTIFLSTAASAIGIRNMQYCDSNVFVSTYINNQSSNGIGVTFNEGSSPTTNENGVYSIHFVHLAMDSVTGGTGLLFNKTSANVINGFEYSTAGTAYVDNAPSYNTYKITTTAGTIGTVNHGFPVDKLNSQFNASAITGNGAAQTFYTYSLPAGSVAQGAGLRIRAGWQHSSGTASVAYALSLNGVNLVALSDATAGQYLVDLTVLASAATTGVETGTLGRAGNLLVAAQAVAGLSWASAQTLQITFNVAATDQITPEFWLVEMVQ